MPVGNAVFLLNLLQDVNILRPLIFIASRDVGLRAEIFISDTFSRLDVTGVWTDELNEIIKSAGAYKYHFKNKMEALQILQGKAGIIVAASESNLGPHKTAHDF